MIGECDSFPEPTWFVGCGNMGRAILDGWRAGGRSSLARADGHSAERHSRSRASGSSRSLAEAGPPPQAGGARVQAAEARRDRAAAAPVADRQDGRGFDARRGRSREPARALPGRRGDRPRDAQSSGRGPPRSRRPVQRRCRRRAPASSSASCSSTLGLRAWMVDEAKLAALGAVAGAGPAYVARFIDALTKAGEQRGLEP